MASALRSTPPDSTLWSPADLVASLAAGGPAVVALSGGVDSSVVAALAFRALGSRAHAVTLTGPAVSSDELGRAAQAALVIGIAHVTVEADVMADPSYRENPSNRCYFCRRTESTALRAWAQGRPFTQFLDGVHLDDLGEDRPGLAAMAEAGFVHPLVRAGWGKSEVRRYAREIGLPNWDAPSNACLASRITHGSPITIDVLRRVEVAEGEVRTLGFRRVRVRTDGTSARVVVDAAELPHLLDPDTARIVVDRVRRAGFLDVTLDSAGYVSREPR